MRQDVDQMLPALQPILSCPPVLPRSRVAARIAAEGYAHASGRLFWGGVKEFVDGSLGSCTALMHEPYLDCGGSGSRGGDGGSVVDGSVGGEPPTEAGGAAGGAAGHGILMIGLAELQGLVEGADKAGLQVRGERAGPL